MCEKQRKCDERGIAQNRDCASFWECAEKIFARAMKLISDETRVRLIAGVTPDGILADETYAGGMEKMAALDLMFSSLSANGVCKEAVSCYDAFRRMCDNGAAVTIAMRYANKKNME